MLKKIIIFVGIGCISLLIFTMISHRVIVTQQVIEEAHPIATIHFSNGESIKMELYPEQAPNTVRNFIYLAEKDFYNGTFINRVIPGYFIQLGDPIGNGYGYPGYFIKSECKYNGVRNRLTHTKGTVSMARSSAFDTEGCQFFILLEDDKSLDGQYASFGRVIEGIESLENMGTIELDENYLPRESITIDSIELEFNNYNIANLESVIAGDED